MLESLLSWPNIWGVGFRARLREWASVSQESYSFLEANPRHQIQDTAASVPSILADKGSYSMHGPVVTVADSGVTGTCRCQQAVSLSQGMRTVLV